LAWGVEVNDEHPAIIESQSFNSSLGITTFAYMAGTLEEMAKRFKSRLESNGNNFI